LNYVHASLSTVFLFLFFILTPPVDRSPGTELGTPDINYSTGSQ